MCPYSRNQIKYCEKHHGPVQSGKMKSFNHIMSSQRITIERAFGMFVRKWGILWRSLEYSEEINILIVIVCAKLHNICIDSWKKQGKERDFIFDQDARRTQMRRRSQDARECFDDLSMELEEIDVPTDNAVLQMFNNYVKPKCQAARVDSKKRVCLVSKIFDEGFFYNSQWDNEIR